MDNTLYQKQARVSNCSCKLKVIILVDGKIKSWWSFLFPSFNFKLTVNFQKYMQCKSSINQKYDIMRSVPDMSTTVMYAALLPLQSL